MTASIDIHTAYIRYMACVSIVIQKLYAEHNQVLFSLWDMEHSGFSGKLLYPDHVEGSKINSNFILHHSLNKELKMRINFSVNPFEKAYVKVIDLSALDDKLESDLSSSVEEISNQLVELIKQYDETNPIYEALTPDESVKIIVDVYELEDIKNYVVNLSDGSSSCFQLHKDFPIPFTLGGFMHFKEGESPQYFDKQKMH